MAKEAVKTCIPSAKLAALAAYLGINFPYLSKRDLVTSSKVRARIRELWLDLLHQPSNRFLDGRLTLLLSFGRVQAIQLALEFRVEGIREQADPSTTERAAELIGGGDQMRRIPIDQELRNDTGLDEDLAVVRQRRDQATGVDLQVLGRPRGVQVDDDLLKGDLELFQDNMSPVRPLSSVRLHSHDS